MGLFKFCVILCSGSTFFIVSMCSESVVLIFSTISSFIKIIWLKSSMIPKFYLSVAPLFVQRQGKSVLFFFNRTGSCKVLVLLGWPWIEAIVCTKGNGYVYMIQ